LVFNLAGTKLKWQDGSTDSVFLAYKAGSYFVEVEANNCKRRYETEISECEILEMPNLFTPNADGINDVFEPRILLGIAEASMEIFNRWGKRVSQVSDLKKEGWDGNDNQDGVYFWIVNYKNQRGEIKRQTGTVLKSGN
jgi:gliding motility-associated-like protein